MWGMREDEYPKKGVERNHSESTWHSLCPRIPKRELKVTSTMPTTKIYIMYPKKGVERILQVFLYRSDKLRIPKRELKVFSRCSLCAFPFRIPKRELKGCCARPPRRGARSVSQKGS